MSGRGRRRLVEVAPETETDLLRRRWVFTEAAFLSVGAGVLLLFVAPPLAVHGLRRLGGGSFLGFGAWLDVAATREWKESARALSAGRRVSLPGLPDGVRSGVAAGLGLGLLLLAVVHRR
jgi:hypothetical protein